MEGLELHREYNFLSQRVVITFFFCSDIYFYFES